MPLKRSLDHNSFFSLDRYVNEFIQITSFFERSSFKLIWWNRELTLKCKLKCYVKHMKDPLGVSPSKGNQGTTRGKEKNSFDLGGSRQSNGRSNPEVVGSILTRP